MFGFQSTLPRRERHKYILLLFSINNFNPRSREGSDWRAGEYCKLISHFNPRSREGSDRIFSIPSNSYFYFNPRSREGSDGTTEINKPVLKQFQSTLPRRERQYPEAGFTDPLNISIHAPAKGATITSKVCVRSGMISIHAPAKGATASQFESDIRIAISIHAPAKGATSFTQVTGDFKNISIHAPAKGATAIFHKIINLYCETSTNTTRINSLNINKNYISRIKASILNYFRVRITL